MKCPTCGYLSFEDLEKCRKCGGSLFSLGKERSEGKGSLHQEELFSPSRDNEGPAQEETVNSLVPGEGEPIEEAPSTLEDSVFSDAEGGNTSPSPPVVPVPIIDDESGIPEDLWVEEGAGFLARLQAVAIDLAILGGVLLLFLVAAVLVLSTSGYGWTRLKTPEGIAALFLPFYLLGLFLSLSYFTFFLGWSGRTPGKTLLSLDVRRTDGGEMTYTRGFLRGVGYLVSLTFAGLGFLWIVFDERKRGWHDYLSGTWVKDLKSER